MNRYETNLKNTSPVIDDLRNEYSKMPRGVFDLSHRKAFDVSYGAIVPIGCWEMLPNSELILNYDVQLLSHNPTLRRLLSGANVELRTYVRKYNDSWEGWNNFITKGRSGTVTKTLPYLDLCFGTDKHTNASYMLSLVPHSPSSYLGILPPIIFGSPNDFVNPLSNTFCFSKNQRRAYYPKVGDPTNWNFSDILTSISNINTLDSYFSSNSLKVSALPFVTYNSICREFWDSNVMQNNKAWYPDNEYEEQFIPYGFEGSCYTSDYSELKKWVDGIYNENNKPNFVINVFNNACLNWLHFADKRGDYFTTGSPFPDLIRGDVPTIEILNPQLSGTVTSSIDFTDSISDSATAQGGVNNVSINADTVKLIAGTLNNGQTINNGAHTQLLQALNKAKVTSTLSSASINALYFSLNQWRALATLTVFMERMARTDGSYNELIKAQFGHNPRWHGHRPTYCGGSRQSIVFSEVVQSNQSNDTPLGTTAGRAVSSQANNTIHVRSDDFACAMTVMVIRPDEYYCQGVPKMWSRLNNAEQYFPILNNLAPDATLNKELFISGDNDVDNDVFNYQERFAYYKSIMNKVSGLMSVATSKVGSIGLYVMHRLFSSTPNFNHSFQTDNEDSNMKSVFASSDESEFVCSVACNAKFIAPIPEITVPSDMGISY